MKKPLVNDTSLTPADMQRMASSDFENAFRLFCPEKDTSLMSNRRDFFVWFARFTENGSQQLLATHMQRRLHGDTTPMIIGRVTDADYRRYAHLKEAR